MESLYIQIDVKEVTDNYVVCYMYTGVLCPKIVMSRSDYEELKRKKFFIREGKTRDSANVLNTTETFHIKTK